MLFDVEADGSIGLDWKLNNFDGQLSNAIKTFMNY
jgi:hypothetical protein